MRGRIRERLCPELQALRDQNRSLRADYRQIVAQRDYWMARAVKADARRPLTEEEIDDIWNRYCDEMGEASINDAYDIARAIERAHNITGGNE
jgi:hypothetical protein